MNEITIDNFDKKFTEISFALQKANFVGNQVYKMFEEIYL